MSTEPGPQSQGTGTSLVVTVPPRLATGTSMPACGPDSAAGPGDRDAGLSVSQSPQLGACPACHQWAM
jgi:hypothetical protein